MTTHEEGREYDVILAGGGTAACVIAGRLAQADPNLSILIVEGGKNNLNDPTVTNPAMFLAHLAPDSQTALLYKAKASEYLGGREAIVPCGGILGGGSSINFMMYTRGQACDYDSWKTEGWDFESLLPYFRKLETYHVEDPSINKDLHGYEGPIHISRTYAPRGPEDDILAAAKALGCEEQVDLQDFTTCGGFSRWARYVSLDGQRQDAAHRYIHPLMASGEYPNLHLLLESKVSRVTFDGNRATGIEYAPSHSFQPVTALSNPVVKFIKAKKLVVVSAGALGTPSVLERSGVGKSEILKKLDIPIVSDVPGVGENYQDHNIVLHPYKTTLKPDETIDGLLIGRLNFAQAITDKNPILGWNSIDIGTKLRLADEDAATLGPDFQKLYDRDFTPYPERPVVLIGVLSAFLGDHKILSEKEGEEGQYVTIGTFTAYPYSRGSIHIASCDASVPADFDTGFLSHPADVQIQIWAYKKQREIYRRTNAYAGELKLGHPKFKEGSSAALNEGPAAKGGFRSLEDRKNLKPIEYSADDDVVLEEWVRGNVNTTWHSLGTCKMAPRNEGGVVDKNLSVYGTEGLKLADLSICPENVAANTNNTALMVGEKAASIFARELGIKM